MTAEFPIFGSFFRKIRKYDIVYTIEVVDDGRQIVLDEMKREGNWIVDRLKGKKYAILNKTVNFSVQRDIHPGEYHAYLLDPTIAMTLDVERQKTDTPVPAGADGATTELSPSSSIYKCRADTKMLNSIIDSQIMRQTFTTKSDTGTLIICLVFGMFIGALLLGPIIGAFI